MEESNDLRTGHKRVQTLAQRLQIREALAQSHTEITPVGPRDLIGEDDRDRGARRARLSIRGIGPLKRRRSRQIGEQLVQGIPIVPRALEPWEALQELR